MTNGKIAIAVVGGYLLGRTKKAKLALGLGMMLAGKKITLDPQQLARTVAGAPVLSGLNAQVRKELVDATKSAATKALTTRANGLAESLQERTASLKGVAGDERDDDERADDERADDERADDERADDERDDDERADDERDDDERDDDEASADEASADEGERRSKPRRAASAKAPAGRARKAASTATKSGTKGAAKKTAAKKTAAKKTASTGGGRRG
ncbi:hypothetical protein ABZU86_00415 [Streptomyces sp. NPDC005271]|uniref:hypothetical protein n=1 Tax=Streptomyces sp. NPDC005271 TaxID=3157030 RepID=UPI0033BE17DE